MREPFIYNKEVFGGTEYMARAWHCHVEPYAPKFKDYLSIVIPGLVPRTFDLLNSKQQIIIWMHNTPEQYNLDNVDVLRNPRFLEKVKNFIVPSEAHKKLILLEIPVNPDLIIVIPNAIEPLKYNPIKFDNPKQVKIIHTSNQDRGMDVLLNSLAFTDADYRLEIYNQFNPDLLENIPDLPNVRFYGRTPRRTVREAIEASHIHAYPSTYHETFCLSQVEAMSAGLLCLTSDYGALPEVSGGFGRMYPYIEDRLEHAKVFAGHLSQAISDIRDGKFDPTAQVEYVNNKYSWQAIKDKWLEYHETL